jgi:hypothetical protein
MKKIILFHFLEDTIETYTTFKTGGKWKISNANSEFDI